MIRILGVQVYASRPDFDADSGFSLARRTYLVTTNKTEQRMWQRVETLFVTSVAALFVTTLHTSHDFA